MEPHRTGRNEPRASLIEPGRTLGPHLVLSTLSSGPRSVVYLAQDLSLDRPVALKTAPRGAISVIAEGRVLARLNHPNIVTLHGLWSEPPILILEYLVGETLKGYRERAGALPEGGVSRWMREILGALEAIHGQGLAHGAIRADNVFLTTDRHIKLLDFRQTSLGESPPQPADDVRAAGRLMQELLGTEAGVLAEIAHGASLGRYPTARALRLAIAAAHRSGETEETPDIVLTPTNRTPAIAAPAEDPEERGRPRTGTAGTLAPAAEPPGLLEEPFINPILPTFHEPPGTRRPLSRHQRLGLALVLLAAVVLLGAKIGWPHRREALGPVAHAVARMTRGVMTGTGLRGPAGLAARSAAGRRGPDRPKTTRTAVRPGAYAALAHAWGG